jgi:hypothetical protein
MRNRPTTMILIVALLLAFATVVISSTLSADDRGAAHTMPDGKSMPGGAMP